MDEQEFYYRMIFDGFTILVGDDPTGHIMFKPEKGSESDKTKEMCEIMRLKCYSSPSFIGEIWFGPNEDYDPPRWEGAFDGAFDAIRKMGIYPEFREEYIVPPGEKKVKYQPNAFPIVH